MHSLTFCLLSSMVIVVGLIVNWCWITLLGVVSQCPISDDGCNDNLQSHNQTDYRARSWLWHRRLLLPLPMQLTTATFRGVNGGGMGGCIPPIILARGDPMPLIPPAAVAVLRMHRGPSGYSLPWTSKFSDILHSTVSDRICLFS